MTQEVYLLSRKASCQKCSIATKYYIIRDEHARARLQTGKYRTLKDVVAFLLFLHQSYSKSYEQVCSKMEISVGSKRFEDEYRKNEGNVQL